MTTATTGEKATVGAMTVVHRDDSPEAVLKGRRWDAPEEFLCLSVRPDSSDHFESSQAVLKWVNQFRAQEFDKLEERRNARSPALTIPVLILLPSISQLPKPWNAERRRREEIVEAGAVLIERDSDLDVDDAENQITAQFGIAASSAAATGVASGPAPSPFHSGPLDLPPTPEGQAFGNPALLDDKELRKMQERVAKMFAEGQARHWTELDY